MARIPRAIVDLDDFTESKNILIYGDTGTGKTILTGQLPGRVLILSSEGGTIVIKRFLQKQGKDDAKRFKVWPIRRWDDLEDAYKYLRDGGADDYDWVAIDSLTSLQHRALRAAMEEAVKRNPEKRDIDLPDRGEHQKHQNATKRMVQDFNELPVNVLWLAQSMYREDRDGNEIVLPFVMGKDYEVSSFVCANVHAFGAYLKQPSKTTPGATRRVLLWDSFADEGGINHWAKDRYQVFPKVVVMADGDVQKRSFADLLAMIDDVPGAHGKAERAVDTRDEPEDDADEDDSPPDPSQAPATADAQDEKPLDEVHTEEEIAEAKAEKEALDKEIEATRHAEEEATDEPQGRGAAMADEDWDADDDEPDTETLNQVYDRDARRSHLEAMDKDALRTAVTDAEIDLATLKGVKKAEVITRVLDAEEAKANSGTERQAPVDPEESTEDASETTTKKRFRATDDEEN